MNVIVIVPFPVTNDIIVDGYNVYKIYKSEIELHKVINEIEKSEEDHMILSYIYPISNTFSINKKNIEIYISDLYGELIKIKEEKDIVTYEKYILEEQYKQYNCKKYPSTNDIKIVIYSEPEKKYLNNFFTKEFKFQLMSEFFNYFVSNFIEKIDISNLRKDESSIFTYIDLFKYLLNAKYPFLGNITEIIQQISYETQYDDFFDKSNIKDFPTVYTIKKYNTNKTLSKIKNILDDFSAEGAGSLKGIENYYFITSNGYKINISKEGELSIERDLSGGLTSNGKMFLD